MRFLGKGQCAQGPFVEKVTLPCDRPPRSLGVSEWNSTVCVNALSKECGSNFAVQQGDPVVPAAERRDPGNLTVHRVSDSDSDRSGNDARSKELCDCGRC